MHRLLPATLLSLAAASCAWADAPGAFRPPYEVPATRSALASRFPINAATRAGNRFVAAGARGHILVSEDGRQWKQAEVPVSADLLALHFPSPRQGWAVGHGGVVLHSADGGLNWTVQLDGPRAAALAVDYYRRRVDSGHSEFVPSLKDAELLASQGGSNPFLDVWFEDERCGFVVGAFNLIFRTEDGGQSWTPWLDRTDNPKALHLYGIRPAAGALYIAGEQGLVLRLDPEGRRFTAVPVPYQGTFFGVTGNAKAVIAYGLRGNAWRSPDGVAHWQQVDTGARAGLVAATTTSEGGIVLVSQTGEVLYSNNDGASFRKRREERLQPAFGVADTGGRDLLVAGPKGLRIEAAR